MTKEVFNPCPKWIMVDPDMCQGWAVFNGTRVPIGMLIDNMDSDDDLVYATNLCGISLEQAQAVWDLWKQGKIDEDFIRRKHYPRTKPLF